MKILGIETSCDETGLAIVEAKGGLRAPRFKVLANLVSSQIKIHRPFGGVVPNLAKREHLKNLPLLWQRILNFECGMWNKHKKIGRLNSKFQIPNSIDLIAVTVGPGLEPALWTGINFAQDLASEQREANAENRKRVRRGSMSSPRRSAPALVGTNHLEGHLYSFLLTKSQQKNAGRRASSVKKIFPAVALIVSGGHTLILNVKSFSKWKKIGETRDDAAGEAFDKVARMLKLPYPGGPEIEKLAAKGNPFNITFPRPMLDQQNYDFSFSGLKTSVLYYLRDNPRSNKADVAAGFEQAAVDVLVAKTRRAVEENGAESIILSGGVAANKHLRKAMKRAADLICAQFFVPDFKYNLDNAAMIAASGYMTYLRKKKYRLAANGNLAI